ncbi:2-oxoadipate dioxygenase/decarboxylase [Streptomyces iconiensis]|uniref:2-oxoadipate dioxygenase/decarboxylase n=1 Tax=Streptomyces iconiensis TaxID=1384038 RepID=A0ABT7A114_9ACTN|nr:VOC family protein [Streptomyces iconiensis]MDJ1135022.1 VOC family protein [Streptomyces iconiensis]
MTPSPSSPLTPSPSPSPSPSTTVPAHELRARFARALSDLYGEEVPAYTTLVEVSQQVNADVIAERGSDAERLGDLARVTAERHGAIRVGTPEELAQVARVFGAVGMYPTGFYDLREAEPNPVPVVSTAFRPLDGDELARNPFRVFTSLLVPEDRRFFDAGLEDRLRTFLAGRRLFPDELLELADRAEEGGGLAPADADRFIALATASFALSDEPVDRTWYAELEEVSSVAADIGGVTSTHINHLTPRVLDIDALYARMGERGIEMIDRIQGPPRWDGPDVLLRQTSFRALSEPRRFREADGSVGSGTLRVRFGEVEARGIALTRAGRDLYDRALGSGEWESLMPRTERELLARGLAFFRFTAVPEKVAAPVSDDLLTLVDEGLLVAEPIVYEDFLPRSAAGIFSSNLTGQGSVDASRDAAVRDAAWMAEVIGRTVHDPYDLYAAQSEASLERAAQALGLPEGVRTSGV